MNNRILKALPAKDLKIISALLKSIVLAKDTVLYEQGERISNVFFPEDALTSVFSATSEGETIEVSLIGNEGIVGIAALFADSAAFRAVVHVPGVAYSMSKEALRREFKRSEAFHRILLHYTNALLVQIAQTAVCNKFHSVQERFCRWLLMAHDRVPGNELHLTQDALARVLGSRRASVSVVAGEFQRDGAIRYSRGLIHIIDRKPLEAASCECYHTISGAHDD
jgi:CRP-like cAMP-binding protein